MEKSDLIFLEKDWELAAITGTGTIQNKFIDDGGNPSHGDFQLKTFYITCPRLKTCSAAGRRGNTGIVTVQRGHRRVDIAKRRGRRLDTNGQLEHRNGRKVPGELSTNWGCAVRCIP